MRRVVTGALAAAVLSWAQGVQAADDATKERKEAADATKAEVKQEGREAQQSMERAADKTASDARAAAGSGEKKHPMFEGKNNFDLKGKVAKVSADSITIQRDELPDATLHVSKNTKIELDGKKVSTQQLKRGQDVKASFNLHGAKAEAVEINADKLEGDASKEMSEQKQETQKELQERQQKAQPK